MATRSDVVEFLNLFKGCLELGYWHVKDREKNLQALIDLNMSPARRKEILLGLTPEDYHSGPEPDDTDTSKEVWKFGATVDGTEIYIKVRVAEDPRGAHRAMVWSFHPAEFKINYPLREGGR